MITLQSFFLKQKFSCFSLLFLVSVFFAAIALPVSGQAQLFPTGTASDTTETSGAEWPEDPLGRRTPRGTVSGFIGAVAEQNYIRAAQYLNISSGLQNSGEGAELARTLQRLLDHSGYIFPYSRINNETEGGVPEEGLAAGVVRVGTISVEDEIFNVLVEKTDGPEGGPVWLFSAETLQNVSALGSAAGIPLVDRLLPSFLQEISWGGVPVGQWLSMLILAVLAYLVAWAITKFSLFLIRRFWHKAITEPVGGILKAFALPIRLYLALWIFVFSSQEVGISIILRQRFSWVTVIVGLTAFLLLLWRLSEFISGFSERKLLSRGYISGVSAVLFLRRLAKIIIIAFGIIAILGTLGVDVTTGLAALGIGGIALALGAQKTVENFVGSVTLIADQPIRVGDFCKAGDTIGTVESIGMRSTRIRTLDRTIVTIPNGEFSSIKIENYAHRDRFRFAPVLNLRYETTPDQLRYLLVELRSVLYAHPLVSPDPARIRFVELGAASLNLEFFAYINAKDFNEFLEVKEDLLLRIMDVVEASGTGFAFPSQTLYLARDTGLSEEKTREAEERVKKWKESGEMQIPSFDPNRIEELRNSISYPPEGSAQKSKGQK